MSTVVQNVTFNTEVFSSEKIQLLKNTVCKGASDNEFQLFLHVCQKTGLDPFMKQIHSIPRGGTRTIQSGIDGLRLIAERTRRYAPGARPIFEYDANGKLLSATSFVKKQTQDGSWHEVSATAFYAEYAAETPFWKKMPHNQLAKCAEALALRKAFPAELSGIYSTDEMEQADNPIVEVKETIVPKIEVSEDEKNALLEKFCSQFPGDDKEFILEYLTKYSNHWKKDLVTSINDYKDKDKFLYDFNRWKTKKLSSK